MSSRPAANRLFVAVSAALLLPACASAPESSREPAEVALARVRDDAAWQRERRGELDRMFGRIVDARGSDDALQWLRVYLLSQVADEKDRNTRVTDDDELKSELSTLAAESSRAGRDFAGEMKTLRDEVEALRSMLSMPAVASAARAPSGK